MRFSMVSTAAVLALDVFAAPLPPIAGPILHLICRFTRHPSLGRIQQQPPKTMSVAEYQRDVAWVTYAYFDCLVQELERQKINVNPFRQEHGGSGIS